MVPFGDAPHTVDNVWTVASSSFGTDVLQTATKMDNDPQTSTHIVSGTSETSSNSDGASQAVADSNEITTVSDSAGSLEITDALGDNIKLSLDGDHVVISQKFTIDQATADGYVKLSADGNGGHTNEFYFSKQDTLAKEFLLDDGILGLKIEFEGKSETVTYNPDGSLIGNFTDAEGREGSVVLQPGAYVSWDQYHAYGVDPDIYGQDTVYYRSVGKVNFDGSGEGLYYYPDGKLAIKTQGSASGYVQELYDSEGQLRHKIVQNWETLASYEERMEETNLGVFKTIVSSDGSGGIVRSYSIDGEAVDYDPFVHYQSMGVGVYDVGPESIGSIAHYDLLNYVTGKDKHYQGGPAFIAADGRVEYVNFQDIAVSIDEDGGLVFDGPGMTLKRDSQGAIEVHAQLNGGWYDWLDHYQKTAEGSINYNSDGSLTSYSFADRDGDQITQSEVNFHDDGTLDRLTYLTPDGNTNYIDYYQNGSYERGVTAENGALIIHETWSNSTQSASYFDNDGAFVYSEAASTGWSATRAIGRDGTTKISFNGALSASQVSAEQAGCNLVFSIPQSETKFQIDNWYTSLLPAEHVINFSDGTEWKITDLLSRFPPNVTTDGSYGDDYLSYEDGLNHLFNGKSGNDLIQAGAGADVFLYNLEDGSDTVIGAEYKDTLRFAPGISRSDISLSMANTSLIVRLNDTSDSITFQNWNADSPEKFSNIQLSDRTLLDVSTEIARTYFVELGINPVNVVAVSNNMAIGTEKSEALYGFSGNDYLMGGGGNDILAGGAGDDTIIGSDGSDDTLIGDSGSDILADGTGNDTYIFDMGSGNDRIEDADRNTGAAKGIDTIHFDSTVNAEDVLLRREHDDLILEYGTSNSIRVVNQFATYAGAGVFGIERIEFSNGAHWDADDFVLMFQSEDRPQYEDVQSMAEIVGNNSLEFSLA